jgi:uncharacterized LabA/DUF88 family protein
VGLFCLTGEIGLLRTSIVIDYQNMHLTGRDVFAHGTRAGDVLLDPGRLARHLIAQRNAAQRPGYPHADLVRVLVFRGEPSGLVEPEAQANSHAQRQRWLKDPLVHIECRPLKYHYAYGSDGRRKIDANGRPMLKGKQEKGVDVLCALAVVRQARLEDIDLVILASHDTDLIPALEEAANDGHQDRDLLLACHH